MTLPAFSILAALAFTDPAAASALNSLLTALRTQATGRLFGVPTRAAR